MTANGAAPRFIDWLVPEGHFWPMCPLCLDSIRQLFLPIETWIYWHCQNCDLRYMDPRFHLRADDERDRYLLHEPGEDGYRNFVTPLLIRVRELAGPDSRVLDFGSGPHPVLASWLAEMGYAVTAYDPFFSPIQVEGLYDLIVACEVMEHLYSPGRELTGLFKLLKPGGALVFMTDLMAEGKNFADWYYRRDPTHVCFYSRRTCEWIASRHGGEQLFVDGRLVSMRSSRA